MTISLEQLRVMYLHDLTLPDTFHGSNNPKARNLEQWRNIESTTKANPIVITNQQVWVWSDLHFFHNNIISYSKRPFDDVNSMNDALIRAYSQLVKPNDIVIWNGDIAFKGHTIINTILNQLPGYKIQVIGNHDIDRNGKLIQYDFDERHLCYVIERDGIQFLFTHYHMDVIPPKSVNVHGHLHTKTAHPWNINVCVEHTNYAPLNFDVVVDQAKLYLSTQ